MVTLVRRGIALMLFHLDRFKPDAAGGLLVDLLCYMVENDFGESLAADLREHAKVH